MGNSFQGWLARALKIQKNPLVKTGAKTSLWLRNIAIVCPWWHQGRFGAEVNPDQTIAEVDLDQIGAEVNLD